MKKDIVKKLRSPAFWLSLSGAVVMVLQLLGMRVNAPYVNEVISAVCSVFVITGIMTPDENSSDDVTVEKDEHAEKTDKDESGE